MYGDIYAFNGLVRTLLIRNGHEEQLKEKLKSVNTSDRVYKEMFIQICRDYPGLPDVRTLKAHQIRFFYDGLRGELKEHTKPKG